MAMMKDNPANRAKAAKALENGSLKRNNALEAKAQKKALENKKKGSR